MKKIITILMMLLLLPVAFAQEDITKNVAGIAPDHPLYFLDEMFDKIKVSFARTEVKKAEIRLEIAEERLAEYKILVDKNKMESAEKAMRNHELEIAEVDKAKTKMTLTENARIQKRLYQHVIVLEGVREKVPEKAKLGISNALTSSSKVITLIQERLPAEKVMSKDEVRQQIRAELEKEVLGITNVEKPQEQITAKIEEELKRPKASQTISVSDKMFSMFGYED